MVYLLEWNDPDIPENLRDEYHEILRAVPSGRKIEAACQLTDLRNDVLRAGIRAMHPEFSERQVTAKLSRLWLPENLWEKVYGPNSKYMREETCQENHS